MKKTLFGAMFLTLMSGLPFIALAGVDINFGISLPPPIVFQAAPEVIALPDTDDVYVDPEVNADLFFWDGWWWRLWQGHWYRSLYYDRGWAYYEYVPAFYLDVDPGWRGYYRNHHWHGHSWNYERIPYHRVRENWRNWHADRHGERQGTWGGQGYHPRSQYQRQELRYSRQTEYRQRPEVQPYQRGQEYRQRSEVQREYRRDAQAQPQSRTRRYQPQRDAQFQSRQRDVERQRHIARTQAQPPGNPRFQPRQREAQMSQARPRRESSQPRFRTGGQPERGEGSQHQEYRGRLEARDARHRS
jgi:hypothetical protein